MTAAPDPLVLPSRKCVWPWLDGWPDRVAAVVLLPIVLLLLAIICPVLLLVQGRPIFFTSERMMTPKDAFCLLKLRTMTCEAGVDEAVLGGADRHRVTRVGRFLRASRLDELPQIFNVLWGDLRFIGPRPPLRRYVSAFPEVYAGVLERPPGITGLATVRYHAHEADLLGRCGTAEETEAVYRKTCIRAKARLDRFYAQKRSIGLNVLILAWTFSRLMPTFGKRSHMRRNAAAVQSATEPRAVCR